MQALIDLFAFLSVILRAGVLICQSLILGGTLFVLWTARPPHQNVSPTWDDIQRSSRKLIRIAAIALIAVQVLLLYVDSSVLMVTAQISFRDVWGANFFISGALALASALGIAIVVSRRNHPAAALLLAFVTTMLLACIMTSHAAARINGRGPLLLMTALHQMATGFWIGGLPYLILMLARSHDRLTQWSISERYSRSALASVAILVLSGTGLSLSYMGSFAALIGTAYGVMVSAKALMLAGLVVLGSVNYFLIRNEEPGHVIPRLRRIVEAEVGIGITIILTAASLTSQPPARDVLQETVSLHQIVNRMRPEWPHFNLPTYADSSTAPASQAKSESAGDSTSAFQNVDGVPLTQKDLADARESETNHHWMGLVVLAMGLLALLARTRRVRWAEYWPLLLILISVFIFVAADSESWPLGQQGFWACWLKPEVLQHRLAALVCVGFAFFELRVRQHPGTNAGALVFPMMCAIGGALLLTHSHAITNVKESLLVELTHVPLGMLAVCAGWTRWLELRLPNTNWKSPSWIWPICFVLIGAGLLNYREI
jgi:putative copper resistance protein D